MYIEIVGQEIEIEERDCTYYRYHIVDLVSTTSPMSHHECVNSGGNKFREYLTTHNNVRYRLHELEIFLRKSSELTYRVDDVRNLVCRIRLRIISASGLMKRDFFHYPDPFVVATVDESQTVTTNAARKNVNPVWNSSFTLQVRPTSLLCIKLFDQKRFKKRGQGFLGLVNISAGSFLERIIGGAEGEHMKP
jgi:hypothetical protein